MRRVLLLSLLILPGAALADPDDAAHRADRARTRQLNNRAAAVVVRRFAGDDQRESDYRQARARYEREMDDWRERVSDCRSGKYWACDDR
jgi:uncharacterized membrane protein YccC